MISPFKRVAELAVGDLDVLDRPEDVGELQAKELHLLLLGPLENRGLQRVLRRSFRRHVWTAPCQGHCGDQLRGSCSSRTKI